jgi:hypothetical protein
MGKTRKNNNYIGSLGIYYVFDKKSKRVLFFFYIKDKNSHEYACVMLDNFVDYPGRNLTLSQIKKLLADFKKRGPHYAVICSSSEDFQEQVKKHKASSYYSKNWYNKVLQFCGRQTVLANYSIDELMNELVKHCN